MCGSGQSKVQQPTAKKGEVVVNQQKNMGGINNGEYSSNKHAPQNPRISNINLKYDEDMLKKPNHDELERLRNPRKDDVGPIRAQVSKDNLDNFLRGFEGGKGNQLSEMSKFHFPD